MVQKLWIPDNRKIAVYIDSYQDGVLQGRLRSPDGSVQAFPSLSRFLMLMEQMLHDINEPQAETSTRSFSTFLIPLNSSFHRSGTQKGLLATFELQILFRQHSSWQGVILWKEQQRKENFRSVLELVSLMDSVLRSAEGREVI